MDSPSVDHAQHRTPHAHGRWSEVLKRDLPPMLTAKQVSDLLNVRRTQVYALAREGIIPSVRVGRTVRFNRERLLEWIETGGTGRPEGPQ